MMVCGMEVQVRTAHRENVIAYFVKLPAITLLGRVHTGW
jgi:hypothetical protein